MAIFRMKGPSRLLGQWQQGESRRHAAVYCTLIAVLVSKEFCWRCCRAFMHAASCFALYGALCTQGVAAPPLSKAGFRWTAVLQGLYFYRSCLTATSYSPVGSAAIAAAHSSDARTQPCSSSPTNTSSPDQPGPWKEHPLMDEDKYPVSTVGVYDRPASSCPLLNNGKGMRCWQAQAVVIPSKTKIDPSSSKLYSRNSPLAVAGRLGESRMCKVQVQEVRRFR